MRTHFTAFRHSSSRLVPWLAAALLTMWALPSAYADDDDRRVRAAEHYARGIEYAQKPDYALALAEFEAAYALVQHAVTLYNIALAQLGLGREQAAIETLQRYLATSKDAEQRKAAASLLKRLRANSKPAEATAQAPSARLSVVVFPYGEVWIDGQPAGSSPLTIEVTQGPHRIAGGREQPERVVDVVLEPGSLRRVVLPWARADLVRSLVEPTSR